MEICVHAGLHKSGTTTVQHAFAAEFGAVGRVWYPVLGHPEIVNHAPLVWPFLSALVADPHYDTVVNQRLGGPATLQDAIEFAAEHGVEKLVISSESLDTLVDDDVAGLHEAFRGHPVRVLFTVTSPLHRWASIWQEFVRHGFGAAPAPAESLLVEASGLRLDRLSGLIERFPADRKHVRIVSRTSVDTTLTQSVADIFGLGQMRSGSSEPRNESLGDDSVLIAFLNSRAMINGVLVAKDRSFVEEKKREIGRRRIDDFSVEDFAVPEVVSTVAEAEREYLAGAARTGAIILDDPADELARWAEVGLPTWYVEARNGSTGPGGLLQNPEIIGAHWVRARRVFSAEATLGTAGIIEGQIRQQLDQSRAELDAARAQLDVTGETLRSTRQQLRAIRTSRTWRWATKIHSAVNRLLRRSPSAR